MALTARNLRVFEGVLSSNNFTYSAELDAHAVVVGRWAPVTMA
jgi:hypothetical protein